jgi:hypothetical protein
MKAETKATSASPGESAVRQQIEKIEKDSGAIAIAVALHDSETGFELHYKARCWFHAASTIKVPIRSAFCGDRSWRAAAALARARAGNDSLSVVENIPRSGSSLGLNSNSRYTTPSAR